MQCKQANELFSDYIERSLDPALTVSVDNHLAACGSCRDEVTSLRRVWTQLEGMPVVEPPLTLRADIFRALDAQSPAPRETAGWQAAWRAGLQAMFRPRALAYAAAALVCVMGSLEVAHTQRAALDPLGALIRLFRPAAPAVAASVTTAGSNWTTDSSGRRVLHVHLRAVSQNETPVSDLTYQARLVKDSAVPAGSPASARLAKSYGRFSATGEADVSLLMASGQGFPATGASLVITLVAEGHSEGETQQVIVPLKGAGDLQTPSR